MLDALYAQAAGARRRWFEHHPEARRSLRQPVVSVGNLSVGGTGKTPLVACIAEWLIAQGERPAILSRGYKRRNAVDGVVVVSDGSRVCASLDESGDEPLMLARQLPRAVVCVCEDRYTAGVLAERRLDATVHLLDDGFQHVQLSRAFDILVTTPGEITHGRVLPFGRLREAAAAAARADFVVVTDTDLDAARSEAWELGISQFAVGKRVLGATSASGAAGAAGASRAAAESHSAPAFAPDDALSAKPVARVAVVAPVAPVFAVAGIGKPAQFFDMLRRAGHGVVGTMAFADHHRYTGKDAAQIAAAARAAGAALVMTTEKDAVRFEALGSLPFAWFAVSMSLQIEPWEALTESLTLALRRARESA